MSEAASKATSEAVEGDRIVAARERVERLAARLTG